MSTAAIAFDKDEFLDDPLGLLPVEEDNPFLKVLIYGPPGSRKTTLVCQAAKSNPKSVIFVDVEHGIITLRNKFSRENFPYMLGMRRLKMTRFEQVLDLFWALKEGKYPEVKTVIIDTFTSLQARHLNENVDAAAHKDKNRNPFLAVGVDYQINTGAMQRVLTSFRDLPVNLLITAHQLEDKDGDRIFVRPMVTPKVYSTLHGLMDVMAFSWNDIDHEGNETNYLQVRPSRRVEAKSRLTFPSPILKNPTFEDFEEANA